MTKSSWFAYFLHQMSLLSLVCFENLLAMQYMQVEECAAGLHPRLCGGDWAIRCLFISLFWELASNAIFSGRRMRSWATPPTLWRRLGRTSPRSRGKGWGSSPMAAAWIPKVVITLKKISVTYVIKMGFVPNSYPPGQYKYCKLYIAYVTSNES